MADGDWPAWPLTIHGLGRHLIADFRARNLYGNKPMGRTHQIVREGARGDLNLHLAR